MDLQIFDKRPQGFQPSVTIVGSYCTYSNKILLLKRHPATAAGEQWCLSAGKLEKGESYREGAARELKEEVGLDLPLERFKYLGTLYFCYPETMYDFVIYHVMFDCQPRLQLNVSEHTEFKWLTHSQALELPLINGGEFVLDFCLN